MTGTLSKTYQYSAFGEEISFSSSDTNPFRYCGEYYDTETKSIYLRARYYQPSMGRFTAEDPIKDGVNWYVYCGNNPVMFKDPTGHVMEGDKDKYGENSIKYKMLVQLGEAYNAATTNAARSAIHAQAEKLRSFDDNNFNRAILLNNETGANISTTVKGVTIGGNAGHNAVLIMNSSGEGLFFSFYPKNDGKPYDKGEMRFAVLSGDEANQLLYGNGAVSNATTNFGEAENESYNRFVYFDTTNGEGYNMYNEAVSLFDKPGNYSGTGRQCDNITEQILSAGGKWYFENNTPNLSYDDLIKENTHWTNNR